MDEHLPTESTRIADFLRDLEIELKAEGIDDLKRRLIGFELVENELAQARSELDLQILRGSGVVDEYRRGRQADVELPDVEAPDFILRRDNVELLVDLHWLTEGEISLDRQELDRLHNLLSSSSKSEEVIVVWPDKDLLSTSLNLEGIYGYLHELEHSDSATIDQKLLAPFLEVIRATFGRYRVQLHRPSKPAERREGEFDAVGAFKTRIEAAFLSLKESLPRRRLQERARAIESLTDTDIELLISLFQEAMEKEVDQAHLASRLEKQSLSIHG